MKFHQLNSLSGDFHNSILTPIESGKSKKLYKKVSFDN